MPAFKNLWRQVLCLICPLIVYNGPHKVWTHNTYPLKNIFLSWLETSLCEVTDISYLSQILGTHLHLRSKNCFKKEENVFYCWGHWLQVGGLQPRQPHLPDSGMQDRGDTGPEKYLHEGMSLSLFSWKAKLASAQSWTQVKLTISSEGWRLRTGKRRPWMAWLSSCSKKEDVLQDFQTAQKFYHGWRFLNISTSQSVVWDP